MMPMKPDALNVPNPYPDELLLSWIHRVASANALSDFLFARSYFDRRTGRRASLPADVRTGFPDLIRALGREADMKDLFLRTSTFPFESMTMTPGQQTRYVNNVFRPADKLNAPVDSLFQTIRVCPECMAEDTARYGEPYLHRAHHLSGVCACHKHSVPLLVLKELPWEEVLYDTDDYEEMAATGASDAVYASYAAALLISGVSADAYTLKRLLFRRMAERGYGAADGYESFLADFEAWEHADLWDGGDIVRFLMVKLIQAQYLTPQEVLPLLMFLYPDAEELIGLLSEHEPAIEQYTCQKCGEVYCATPQSVEDGWGCPACDAAVPEDVRLRRIINTMTDGDYVPAGDFASLNEKMDLVHKACGETISVKPRSFLFESVRCLCESTVTEEDARMAVAANDGFELVSFNGTNEPVEIRHAECGRTFTCRYHKFLRFPGCRACSPPHMTTKAYKERVKALTGNEYTVVGKFVDQHTKIAIRHNTCGRTQLYQPNHFLEGQRCHECGKMPAWDKSFAILKQYRDEFGNVNIPKRASYHGYSLGRWCQIQREQKDRLSDTQIKRLDTLGFLWDPLEDAWEENRALYEWYAKENGSPYIARRTDFNGIHLGAWVDTQKKRYREGKLSDERKKKLLLINPELFNTRSKDGR